MGKAGDDGVIDGVKYDHVLPIEVDVADGGVAKLQIGYNNGENTFVAAQRFVDAHMLPQFHLQQIADYIQQRTGSGRDSGRTIGMDTDGGGAQQQLPILEKLPNKVYKTFGISKLTKFDKMIEKLVEVGKLDDTQIAHLSSLTSVLSETSRYHASKLPAEAATVLTKILQEFTPDQAFPALDLLRYAALHPDCTTWTNWSDLLRTAKELCNKEGGGAAVPMLTLRLYANGFQHLSSYIVLENALQMTEQHKSSSNKNIRLSVATLWMNIATFLQKDPSAPDISSTLIPQIHSTLRANYASEATTRMLWALGTCLVARTSNGKDIVSSLGMWSQIEMIASPHGDVAKKLAKEIYCIQNPHMGV